MRPPAENSHPAAKLLARRRPRMRWFSRRPVRPSRPQARRPRLWAESLEAREVPAATAAHVWFLSSTWVAARVAPVTPPDTGEPGPTPTPSNPPATPTIALAAASDNGTAGDKITTLSA